VTKREHIPAGYEFSLDRRQPEPLGLSKIVIPLAILLALCPVIYFSARQLLAQHNPEPSAPPTAMVLPTNTSTATQTATATASATFTPDDWSRTGTALARVTITPSPTNTATLTPLPTLDYCWFLTPSPTPSPTYA
jgi:hypothetical protein